MTCHKILAAAFAVVAMARPTLAHFTFSAAPSLEPAPAGRFAVDLFAQNDSDPVNGVNLQAVRLNYTGLPGTTVFFAGVVENNGSVTIDTYNYTPGTTGSTVIDPGSSNLRIGTRTQSQHSSPDYPGDFNSPVTPYELTHGLQKFTATWGLLGSAISYPALDAPGARFARLVFNQPSPVFSITGQVGGEVGLGEYYALTYSASKFTALAPPSVTPTPPVAVSFGAGGSAASFSTTVVASDATSPLTLSIDSLPAGVHGIAISAPAIAGSLQTFTVSGLLDYSPGIRSVEIPFLITNQLGAATPGTFTLVVPEPVSLAGIAVATLLLRRRR